MPFTRASIQMGGHDAAAQERERDELVATLRGGVLPPGGRIVEASYVPPIDTPTIVWLARIVVNQANESGLLYRAIKRLNPNAPVTQFVGTWAHTAEMRPLARMPIALARMGLLNLTATGSPT